MRLFIILVCVIAVGATIGTIVIGNRTFDGVVVDKPYESGLAWDQVRLRTANLGWTVSLSPTDFKTGKNEVQISVLDVKKLPLADAEVSVALSRPSTREYDRTYQAKRVKDGEYIVSIDIPAYGYWDLRIDVSRKEQRGSYTKHVYAAQSK